jgi:hypothetical protein
MPFFRIFTDSCGYATYFAKNSYTELKSISMIQNSQENELLSAAKRSDLAKVEACLKNGAPVNDRDAVRQRRLCSVLESSVPYS